MKFGKISNPKLESNGIIISTVQPTNPNNGLLWYEPAKDIFWEWSDEYNNWLSPPALIAINQGVNVITPTANATGGVTASNLPWHRISNKFIIKRIYLRTCCWMNCNDNTYWNIRFERRVASGTGASQISFNTKGNTTAFQWYSQDADYNYDGSNNSEIPIFIAVNSWVFAVANTNNKLWYSLSYEYRRLRN